MDDITVTYTVKVEVKFSPKDRDNLEDAQNFMDYLSNSPTIDEYIKECIHDGNFEVASININVPKD